MSDQDQKSWGGTIIAGIIILVLVVVAIIIIYYVYSLPRPVPFPISPFNYGDVVQIRPAVLAQDNTSIKDPPANQYLTLNVCPNNSCSNCYQPTNNKPLCGSAQPNTCTVTFTGSKDAQASKWILNQWYDSATRDDTKNTTLSAKQNFAQFGNRFYMQNATATNIDDIPKLVTYMAFNGICAWGPERTFPLTGNDNIPPIDSQRYDSPFVVYFLPTTQPDLYYILFPSSYFGDNPPIAPPNTLNPNDGIASLRPFAQPQNDTYNPWNIQNPQIPNASGPLLNLLKDVSPDSSALSTNIPEIFLFEITKA
jgi:hypothetical protein